MSTTGEVIPAQDITITRNQAAVIPGGRGGSIRPIRDSARASELARRRWDRRTAAARAGLRDAAAVLTATVGDKPGLTLPDGSPLETEYDVLRVATTAHALNALDPSAPSSVQSLKTVDAMAFPAPDKVSGTAAPGDGLTLSATFGPELARELLARLAARSASAVDDATTGADSKT